MLLSCYRQQIFYGIQVEDLERVNSYVERGIQRVKEQSAFGETFSNLEQGLENCVGLDTEELLQKLLQEQERGRAPEEMCIRDRGSDVITMPYIADDSLIEKAYQNAVKNQ